MLSRRSQFVDSPKQHAHEGSSDGADASPDRVGGADGDALYSGAQEPEAGKAGGVHQDGGEEAAHPVGVFHRSGPHDLEHAGDEQINPRRHVALPRNVVAKGDDCSGEIVRGLLGR
jgi:hypothetical protein